MIDYFFGYGFGFVSGIIFMLGIAWLFELPLKSERTDDIGSRT